MTAMYLDDGLSAEEIADANAEIQAISRLWTGEIMASSVLKRDKVVEIQGDSYNPPAEIAEIDNSEASQGWIYMLVRRQNGRVGWYRLALSEFITIEG